jgi:hypothetical protein
MTGELTRGKWTAGGNDACPLKIYTRKNDNGNRQSETAGARMIGSERRSQGRRESSSIAVGQRSDGKDRDLVTDAGWRWGRKPGRDRKTRRITSGRQRKPRY